MRDAKDKPTARLNCLLPPRPRTCAPSPIRYSAANGGPAIVSWIPIIVLPNVDVKFRVEGRYAAIVGYYDKRLARLRGKHPAFKRFLSRFRDTFNHVQRPSVLLLHKDKVDVYRESEAVAAFRDLLAICCVPYARAMVLKVGRSHIDTKFSNAFAFFPWMIGRDNESLVATTPALGGFGDNASFTGRTSPEIGYGTVRDLDEPLLKTLIDRWEIRFGAKDAVWPDRALFRSLNMAYHASQTPFDAAGTPYDVGRLIGLWVSAYEILVHGGPNGKQANETAVKQLLTKTNATSSETRTKVCRALYDARHDYLHGNPIKAGTSPDILSHYGSVLYRLALTEFLELHHRIPHIPGRGKRWARRAGKEIAVHIDFNRHQERYEDALDTFIHPRTGRGEVHRRERGAPPLGEVVE